MNRIVQGMVGRVAVVCLLALALLPLHAHALLPVPALSGRVIDQTDSLRAGRKAALETRLQALEADKGAQLIMLLVSSTAPEDIAAYANRVGNSWKIGRAGVGDGLLVVVAKNDRRMRIEVAKTLEGAVTDLQADRIIREAMTPFFRAEDYAGGLEAALDQLDALIRGEDLPPVQAPASDGGGEGLGGLAIFLYLSLPMASAVARHRFGHQRGSVLSGAVVALLTYLVGGSLLLALMGGVLVTLWSLSGALRPAVLSGSGRGGDTGSVYLPGRHGGGSGGFGSGGGGNFGGGGASGRW